MPYTEHDGKLIFIKLEPFKPVYGAWKEDKSNKFIFIRKIDYTSILAGDWNKFAKNFTESQDWYIPIAKKKEFNWYDSRLTVTPEESVFHNLSWILTPSNQRYLMKTRLSASGVMSYGAAMMGFIDPVAIGAAGGWLLYQKQQVKHSLCKNRGERQPSLLPKVLARKCWFVDVEKYNPCEYVNLLFKNKLI